MHFNLYGQASAFEKILLKDSKLYRVSKVKGGYTILEVRDTVSNDTAFLKMPIESAKQFKVPFDISGQFVYAISIMEYAPRQIAIWLVKSDITKLDVLQKSDTSESGTRFKLFGPESIESHTRIAPLSQAVYEAQIREQKLNYSLLASENDKLELFILLGKRLSSWQLEKDEWKETFSDTCSVSGDFIAVKHKARKYLITEGGSVYEVGKKITELADRKILQQGMIMIDKSRDRVYSVPSSGRPSQLKNMSLKKIKEIFDN